MSPPAGHPQFSVAFSLDVDPGVNDGNEMGERNVVERCPRPWAIDAAEENVAVEGSAESGFLDHTELQGLYLRLGGTRRALKGSPKSADLRPVEQRVQHRRVD